MALPLILAMTAAEISTSTSMPESVAWMACHFSPYGQGISNIPTRLPPGSTLILNDRMPCQGHSGDLVVQQLEATVHQFSCRSVLLDFLRPETAESVNMVHQLLQKLSCPVIVSQAYAHNSGCPVLLEPAPLHQPIEEYLQPWQGREIWLETALLQESIEVTRDGTVFSPQFPPSGFSGGFYDQNLLCHYRSEISDNRICFTLYDTRETLVEKLEKAHALGVSQVVGLYQELGRFSEFSAK